VGSEKKNEEIVNDNDRRDDIEELNNSNNSCMKDFDRSGNITAIEAVNHNENIHINYNSNNNESNINNSIDKTSTNNSHNNHINENHTYENKDNHNNAKSLKDNKDIDTDNLNSNDLEKIFVSTIKNESSTSDIKNKFQLNKKNGINEKVLAVEVCVFVCVYYVYIRVYDYILVCIYIYLNDIIYAYIYANMHL
jgi:hypothetical protein